MGVTLRDVAELANVSASTACRALSGHEHIHPATRARVLAAAEELNYEPNRLARSLVRQRSDLIGFVLFDVAHPFFAPVTRGIDDVVRGAGYDLVLTCSYRDQQNERNAVELVRRLRADGFIITPVLAETDHLERLQRTGAKFVVVGRAVRERGFHCVAVNDWRAGRMVAEHLAELGHERIAFVGGGQASNLSEQQRRQGCRQVHEETDLAPIAELDARAGTIAAGRETAERLVALDPRPTAVIAGNDLLAIGLLHGLRDQGVHVPGDMAVVGFDDIEFAQYTEVPLTTVRIPQYNMGRAAAELLLDLLQGEEKNEAEQILVEPELVVRESCG